MTNEEAKKRSVLDTPLSRWFPPTLETLIVVLIIILALFSRFYDLGARVMSHDEINHVVHLMTFIRVVVIIMILFSHGPLQFH
jgi:predicted membrane-bound mannosyltransferase